MSGPTFNRFMSYCLFPTAAIEAGISHGLKKRVGGLLPAYDTQTLLTKLAKVSEAAAELVRKLSGETGEKEGKLSPGTKLVLLKEVLLLP